MPGAPQPDQSTQGVGPTPTSSAGLMALIADVERQLTSLRDADAQRLATEEALAAREAAITERERAAAEAGQRADELTRSLEAQRAEIQTQQEHAASLRSEIEAARSDLQSQRTELERELERLAALESSISKRAESADRAAADAEQRRVQMERTLAEKSAAFRAAEERMEHRATEVSKLLQDAERRVKVHEARAAELTAEIATAREEIRVLQERARNSDEADSLRAMIAERDLSLATLRADLDASSALADEARRAANAASDEVARLTAEAAEQARVVASRNEELKSLRAQVATLKEKSGTDAKSRADAAALQTRIESLESEIGERAAEISALRADLASATSVLDASRRKNDQYLAHIAHVEAELASSRESASAGAADAGLQPKLIAAQEAEAKARAEADKLRAFARTLAEELAEARNAAPGAPMSDEQTAARRDRLRRQRKLLRAQSDKIKRASDAVRDRFEQVEQILTQRAEVIAAKKLLDESKRKLRSRQARAGAVAAVFYVAITLLIYTGLGWLAAQKVAPAVYAVSSRIAADAGGRPLSPAEFDEWRSYHEELLQDPRTLDMVAERMKQRGIASLSTAPALKLRLDADFTFMSREPGTLDLELRGLGSGNTARELDTLVSTVVRQANTARERRVDGSATIVATAAAPDPTPLHDERVFYAAGIAGRVDVALNDRGVDPLAKALRGKGLRGAQRRV
jgi:chromosome segregation ATPase